MKMNKNLINLRVFKRDSDSIVLLWDNDKLSIDKEDQISIMIEKKDVVFAADFILRLNREGTKVMLGIEHSTNSLSSKDHCNVIVGMIDSSKDKLSVMANIEIFPSGVLPETEKDDKDKNLHLMLWDSNALCWRKAEGVEVDGRFVLGVKILE